MPAITPEEARGLMVANIDTEMEVIYAQIRREAAAGKSETTIFDTKITGNRHRANAIISRLYREGFIATYRDAMDQRDSPTITISWRKLTQDDR